jgi:hypothetical protein
MARDVSTSGARYFQVRRDRLSRMLLLFEDPVENTSTGSLQWGSASDRALLQPEIRFNEDAQELSKVPDVVRPCRGTRATSLMMISSRRSERDNRYC